MRTEYSDVDGTKVIVHSIDGWTPEARDRIDAYSRHRIAYIRHDLGYPFGFEGLWVQIYDGNLPVLTDRGYFLVGPQGQLRHVDKALMKTKTYKPADCLAEGGANRELRDAALAVLGNIPPFEFIRQRYTHIDFDSPEVKKNAAASIDLHAIPPRSSLRIWLANLRKQLAGAS